MTNLYDTNKTGPKTSGRMKLKGYHMIKGNHTRLLRHHADRSHENSTHLY